MTKKIFRHSNSNWENIWENKTERMEIAKKWGNTAYTPGVRRTPAEHGSGGEFRPRFAEICQFGYPSDLVYICGF